MPTDPFRTDLLARIKLHYGAAKKLRAHAKNQNLAPATLSRLTANAIDGNKAILVDVLTTYDRLTAKGPTRE